MKTRWKNWRKRQGIFSAAAAAAAVDDCPTHNSVAISKAVVLFCSLEAGKQAGVEWPPLLFFSVNYYYGLHFFLLFSFFHSFLVDSVWAAKTTASTAVIAAVADKAHYR